MASKKRSNDLRSKAIEVAMTAADKCLELIGAGGKTEDQRRVLFSTASFLHSVVRLLDHCDLRGKIDALEEELEKQANSSNLSELVVDLTKKGGRLKKSEGGKFILGPKTSALARKD